MTIKIKNRGAFSNPEGRFETFSREEMDPERYIDDEEILAPLDTILLKEPAKTIISYNDSPDLGFEQSINPYKGCEHGCIYCYARPSHAYMNLSPGLDFETKIFYKPNAAKLLEKELNNKSYKCKPIMIGANTDPYQPAEVKLKVTRSLLEVLEHYSHPFTIITKSSLITRDIDIIARMAEKNLAKVAVSITTLSTKLKHILEPRTSAPKARLNILREFSAAKIPLRVMVAPVIPMINDMELEKILEASSFAGAHFASYVLLRLPYEVKDLFREWLNQHFPDRLNHVMNLVRDMRGGKDYDSTFGVRMKGQGEFANLLNQRFRMACKKFKLNVAPSLDLSIQLFKRPDEFKQMDMFENLKE